MSSPVLQMSFLLAGCFTVATWLGPRLETSLVGRIKDTSALGGILGESRRLLAENFFKKSDAYMHSGFYPSFFDEALKENHVAKPAGPPEETPGKHDHSKKHGETGHVHDEHCEEEEASFLGKPRDWIDAFSRHFFVSKHSHLDEGGNTTAAREILPWMKISAELDPQRVESYTVGAYWLRKMNKPDEAEQFLRAGLRANPDNCEILLELGRSNFDKKDYIRARNLYELAFQRWREQENPKPVEQQNRLLAVQILTQSARLESRAGNPARCLDWLTLLKKASVHPEEIQKRIDEVKAGQPFEATEK